ncbi:glucose-6-phosphate-1-dehydrogenase [Encephalitozoon intestinalis ATCC 50506]|uniref:Glucose-6-phosphate 1-dehydrogenase n=1 Tax=Encephalitozoon intestinalis (strain ATCC 50506) TaxID=876142 RepID=E0S8A6_ENCIT|nr:glucose-6-phosphate-1-dehydrogenase [Encephalitozoon intestinalis ATCC 50506]ADM12112.1 glucose-6-phosphate-1-dehydrogenase [Encephalitozoon intestinalis ATCC 50506]UTX45904.1 glucose-6-phosphate-1-dehydrogenase [Encephalitozoon intestinalis]
MKVVIFGSSGDLAKRKLFPALSRINLKDVEVVGYARTKYDVEYSEVLQEVGNYSPEFLSKVQYVRGSYDDLSRLKDIADPETVLYFSVPPSVYTSILKEASKLKYKVICIEKPYGESIESFAQMKKFDLSKVQFIDHYLLKPLVIAMPGIIRGSSAMKETMNNRHVKSVEIISKEVLGGEGRNYFDKNGIVKDIVQNHMAELLGVVASDVTEPSRTMEALERAKIFDACTIDAEKCIYGQYDDYSKEIHKDSSTETFCIVPINVNTPRWSKVPFIIVAGKGMNEKRTEISIEFKRDVFSKCIELFCEEKKLSNKTVHINEIDVVRLVFNIYPECEVFLEVLVGGDSVKHVLHDKKRINDLMHESYGGYRDYEIIFDSLIRNKSLNSVNLDEVELLWKVFDPILSTDKEETLFYYSKGIDMPEEAEEMIRKIKDH